MAGLIVVNRTPMNNTMQSADFIANGSIAPAAFAGYLDNQAPTLIDIRTPNEFADAHLTGAINIDYYAPDFAAQLATLDKTKPYAIYCRSGNRTSDALRIMRELGFTYVYDLQGGILAWERAGFRTCNAFTC